MDNGPSEVSRKRVLDKLADRVRNNRAMLNPRRYNVAAIIRESQVLYPWITRSQVYKHMRNSEDTTDQVHRGITSNVDLKGGRPQGSTVKYKLTE